MSTHLSSDLLVPPPLSEAEAWLDTPRGGLLMARELDFFDRRAADRFGYYAVQLGFPALPALRASRMPTRLIASETRSVEILRARVQSLRGNRFTGSPQAAGDAAAAAVPQAGGADMPAAHDRPTVAVHPARALCCDLVQLPLASASIDLVVLPHTLDFHPLPREVLREVERVLLPEGRILLTGFNPWSLWGLRRAFGKKHAPWNAHFFTLRRIRDWLALLGLEPVGGTMLGYPPPCTSEIWLTRWGWMEHAGNRWWPLGGAVYCLEAVKRVRGMRMVGLKRKHLPTRSTKSAALSHRTPPARARDG